MKLAEKINEIILKEVSTTEKEKQMEVIKMINEMKNVGLIKTPAYDLPLVDTIGKTYYSSINKRKQ